MRPLPPAPHIVAAATLTVNLMRDPGPGGRVFAVVTGRVDRKDTGHHGRLVELRGLARATASVTSALVADLLKAADAAKGDK